MNMQNINSKAKNGLRELTSDEIMAVSGGGKEFVGLYQDANGIFAVFIENGNQSDVQISTNGGDGGWLDTPRGAGSAAVNGERSWYDRLSDVSLSVGWSYIVAGGLTAYDDGIGLFLGVAARPGLVVNAGTAASGDEAGWDVGPDSVVYQSGPLPIAGSEPVYYDANRYQYYIDGEVWNGELGIYTDPQR